MEHQVWSCPEAGFLVMAGLDPALHGSLLRKAWITGISPVMTTWSHDDTAVREVQ